jgi:lipoyl(octanoyl) transferase
MDSWHLWIDEQPRSGYANMAIDVALLDRTEQVGESWLRLYRWSPHCLSFGRHEPAARQYDLNRIQELGVDTVRRPTGGRAVWHASELTYAITMPADRFPSLRSAYLAIHDLLREALSRIGVSGTLAPTARTAPLEAGSCFAQPVGGEVLVNGRKVIGSAQLRRGSSLLQHGSILLEDSQKFVVSLQRTGAAAEESEGRVGPAPPPLGRRVDSTELAQAVGAAAGTRWSSIPWTQIDHPGRVLDAATKYFPQFQSPEWTWTR